MTNRLHAMTPHTRAEVRSQYTVINYMPLSFRVIASSFSKYRINNWMCQLNALHRTGCYTAT